MPMFKSSSRIFTRVNVSIVSFVLDLDHLDYSLRLLLRLLMLIILLIFVGMSFQQIVRRNRAARLLEWPSSYL